MIYTRSALKARVNANIKGKQGLLVDIDETLNQAVREVVSDIDLRSTKRRAALSPNLFSEVYQYAAPSDLKGQGIIDLAPQVNRSSQSEYNLVLPEEFDRRKEERTIAVDDRDSVKKLLVAGPVDDDTLIISTLDSTTAGGGTWSAVGDAANLEGNSDDYVKGSASLEWDIGSGGTTTAGIQNSTLDTFDITDYRNHSLFAWQYIFSATNLTNFIVNIGSDSSNYLAKTITATSEGNAFASGWNLLRFDLSSATETGTVDLDACDYVKLYMTKTAGKISETGYRTDHLMLKKGSIHNLYYYSKFGWQNTSGTYLENSTSDLDYVNCDTDEYSLFILKATQLAAAEADEVELSEKALRDYLVMRDRYGMNNPSEAKLLTSTYYNF